MAKGTKDALLDAAELLFAEHGIGGTTVRMIAEAAQANVAAVSFHFGSLSALQRAVLLRRFQPIALARTTALRALQARARPPCAVELLHAWLAPMLALSASSDRGEVAFARLLARTLVEPSKEYAALLRKEIEPHGRAFRDAWCAALPELAPEEVANRIDFAIGALGHAFADSSRREAYLSKAQARDLARLTPQLLAFIEAGLVAPPTLKVAGGPNGSSASRRGR
jgi:AcrR family transcriptional regulator